MSMSIRSSSSTTDATNGAQYQTLVPFHPAPPSRLHSGAASIANSHASTVSLSDAVRQDRPEFSSSQSRRHLRLQTGNIQQHAADSMVEDGRAQNTDDSDWHMRHGWDSQYSAEQLRELTTNFYMYFVQKRHESGGMPKTSTVKSEPPDWRMKDRLKTVSAVLPICLNIGVDPPDVFKTSPSAKLECWIDPTAVSASGSNNAISQIAKALQAQYEQLSMRTRYKVLSDPTSEELKKYCISMRKNAKEERILFHFNGHGVPKPTPSGEIWVFNKNYTQYIPISLVDLQSWLGAPSILVYDCINAGLIIRNFNKFVEKHHSQNEEDGRRDPSTLPAMNFNDCIQLAACAEDEMLPTNPMLPADLFTSCLTTPIEIAVRFYLMQSPLRKDYNPEDAAKIPGRSQERRTPIGELNWIFTAITDTIAWNTLPKPLFKRLFRQDLMVAALFRNFLLAQRIMRAYHCHPQCYPEIPSTHDHPLWDSWDLAVELVLSQLPNLQLAEEKKLDYTYQHSDFFKDQLTAFEVYLDQGAREQKEPEQLPIVLQVLLSQVHRLRALVLLSRFLDLGPWAVNLALGIGIFPYVLKLLQSQAQDLKAPLVFIWARVLAVDQECQGDLLKDSGYQYFVSILNPATGLPVSHISEHRAMCAFIIAMFCRNFKQGQIVAHTLELVQSLQTYFSWRQAENPALRQWAVLCLSMLWKDHTDAKWSGIRSGAFRDLCELVQDPVPEVRAAMLYALTAFIGIPDLTEEVMAIEEEIALRLLPVTKDGSTVVRKEFTIFLSAYVARYLNKFIVTALEHAYDAIEKDLLQDIKDDEAEADREGDSDGIPETSPTNPMSRSKSSNVLRDSPAKARARNTSEQVLPSAQNKARNQTHFSLPESPTESRSHGSPANGYAESEAQRKPREDTDKLSKDTIYSAVWMQLLVLAVDPDIQVAQDATIIVREVVRAALDETDDLAFLVLSYYSAYGLKPSRDLPLKTVHHHHTPLGAPPTPDPAPAYKADNYFSASIKRTQSVAASLRNLAFGSSTNLAPPHPPRSPPGTPPANAEAAEKGHTTTYGQSDHEDQHEDRPSSSYRHAKYPTPEWFKPIGPDTPVSLPLQSHFFDYAVEFFREFQMKVTEDEEPGSRDYNERLWRRNRNERILESTQKLKEQAGSSRWDHMTGTFNNGVHPNEMCFHQYENHLVITDDRDTVRVWDWDQHKSLNRFSNGNKAGSLITAVRLINEDDQALLMTGASDGSVRIFKHYEDANQTQVLSSFNAMPKPDPISTNSGLVLDWLQGRGLILAAGDAKNIRTWSAHTELLSNEIPLITTDSGALVVSESCVTSMTSDQVEGHVVVAGFDNGAVRVYDQRLASHNSLVKTWREHKSRIVNVHLQRGGLRELVSGSRDGQVKLWDLRNTPALRTIDATRDSLRTLSVHEHAPVFAVGSERHKIKVFNMDGLFLSSFDPLTLPRQQNRAGAPISSTAFHPHRMMLACSSLGDAHVTLFECRTKKKGVDTGDGP